MSRSFHFLSARYQAKVFTSDNVLLEVKELAYVNVPDAHLALARPCVAAAWSYLIREVLEPSSLSGLTTHSLNIVSVAGSVEMT